MPYYQPPEGPTLYYEEKGAGKPLLLVHDWGTNLRVWDGVVGELASTFRVVSLDLRGHGRSEVTNSVHGIDVFAHDIGAIISGLGLGGVTLAGWSMGGQSCIRYLSRGGGAAKMVLISTTPSFLDISPYQTNWTQDFITRIGELATLPRPTFTKKYLSMYFAGETDPEVIDWMSAMTLSTPTWVTSECSASQFATDLRPVLGAIAIPTLIVHGRRDRIVTHDAAVFASERIPGSRLATLELSGHSPHLEEREAFITELVSFAR